jgi:hypothetical protein
MPISGINPAVGIPPAKNVMREKQKIRKQLSPEGEGK